MQGAGRHTSVLQQHSPTFSCSLQLLLGVALQALACRNGSKRHLRQSEPHSWTSMQAALGPTAQAVVLSRLMWRNKQA